MGPVFHNSKPMLFLLLHSIGNDKIPQMQVKEDTDVQRPVLICCLHEMNGHGYWNPNNLFSKLPPDFGRISMVLPAHVNSDQNKKENIHPSSIDNQHDTILCNVGPSQQFIKLSILHLDC